MHNLTSSSPAKSADLLTQSFDKRQREIDIAKDYVARTQALFNQFGSAELKTSHVRFPELLNALESNEVRLVALGEFSRGKSSLLNSLLGIEVLPTATPPTTAINTFLKALPKGETERHILVHWQDKKRAPQRVEWLEDDWTVVSADDSLSAHYENTILVTKGKPEILTLTEEEIAAGLK